MNFVFALVLFAVFALLIFLVIMCRLAAKKCCCRTLYGLFLRIERKVYLNAILRACLETYFATCINLAVQSNQMRAFTSEERIDVVALFLTACFCFGFPYYAWDWIYRTYFEDRLELEATRQAFDSLYLNIDVGKGPQALAFSLVFLLRRLLFAFVIGKLVSNIVPQILAVDALSMVLLAYYVNVRPMVDRLNNFI